MLKEEEMFSGLAGLLLGAAAGETVFDMFSGWVKRQAGPGILVANINDDRSAEVHSIMSAAELTGLTPFQVRQLVLFGNASEQGWYFDEAAEVEEK